MPSNNFRSFTVVAVIIANMVGTGVFTSLGFQLVDIRSGFALLMLWAIGGLVALGGALTYAELGAALPRSGGEYNLLRRIYHPAAGFVSGWISSTIGFAGPTALGAMTFAAYLSSVFPGGLNDGMRKLVAAALVIVMALAHATNHRTSGSTQLIFTNFKIIVIVGFCLLALLVTNEPQPVNFLPQASDGAVLTSSVFAVSLIYVSFAYSGWNAATYLSSEVDNPQRNLPWILVMGTSIVTVLYVLLNFVFLYVAPMDAMVGQVEVGAIVAESALGAVGGQFVGLVFALLLISTVSAMTMAGPRVIQVIGEDYPALRFFGRTNRHGIPAVAIYTQTAVALTFILTSTFESVLVFAGFTMALNSSAAVFGVFVLRRRQPDLPRPYRTFLFPLPPLVYLTVMGWTLTFTLINRPVEALGSLAIIGSGLLFYFLTLRFQRSRA
ncbi:MAG: amino acid permease [Gammaproteobacteria bacterium]|nr:amino acid permease [Gammaproteobacteria bacterium]MXY90400.1 amino acid permease [Gammaproteobacteria bacterium]MYA68296.1 amino acid permease [Gammaproteobacteria bacterium]MYF00855.1 amino acid permease [Gammaproteobacteria bacterium]MYG95525.1 amino acid permease [Gammaproteobacteria bacterium]